MLDQQDIYKNKNNLYSYLTLYTKFNSMRAINLNVKGKIIRLLVSTEEYLHDTKASNHDLEVNNQTI